MTALVTTPFGDAAVMIAGGGADVRTRVRTLSRMLERRTPHGVTDLVAGLDSLLVRFDPLRTTAESVIDIVQLFDATTTADDAIEATPGRTFTIPVVFDSGAGPDLEPVAAELDTSVDELVATITETTFDVVLLAAGMAPMMEGGQFVRPVRRAAQPRTNVPPGSIMVAGQNAIIQPFPGPTGWRVVGRTPHTIVDIARTAAAAVLPGDRVRYVAIDRADAQHRDGTFLTPDGVVDEVRS
ncbi:5-oxoprolinase subunit B family protein [Curtobacterium sp. VKM Ac-2887]|uniref:5-oxoprolinase subunit B family protein n=1 Tax=Curtobacterium sp. VKM Ac-2887 TaxID=2783819 RepID=UPI00188D9234|nr:carboxyltransferase domain-containing protein [Curtobacterium sp. VKM Ac-2887]MBF4588275.1 carboxyltransferase domain-containing protein [Curtobacterium sp. VKM Ac-2887]